MRICETILDIRDEVRQLRRPDKSIALVPTMGYLHEGHLSLVRTGSTHAERVVVSIFVNPTQFGPGEDFDTYPRDLERDLALLESLNVDAVFMPSSSEMYPQASETIVSVPSQSRILQGALRPGHFDGVTTVVSKLLNIVQPDVAVFGQKDYQQLSIIRRMVRDLNIPVEIIGHPTVREADGLAMSSRNVRLSPEDRDGATILVKALDEVEEMATRKPRQPAEVYINRAHQVIAGEPRAAIGSIDLLDAWELTPIKGNVTEPAILMLAVRFGKVLLIDNRIIPGESEKP